MPVTPVIEHLAYNGHYIPDPIATVTLHKDYAKATYCLASIPASEDDLMIFTSGIINRLCDIEKCSWHNKRLWLKWGVQLDNMDTGEVINYKYDAKKEIYRPEPCGEEKE